MTALRFEVFALAGLHQLGEKPAVAQSIYTKSYLEGEEKSDVLEAMELQSCDSAIRYSRVYSRHARRSRSYCFCG